MKIKIPTKDLEKYLSEQYQGKNMKLKAYYEYCATCEHPDAKRLQFVVPDFFEIEIPDEQIAERPDTGEIGDKIKKDFPNMGMME